MFAKSTRTNGYILHILIPELFPYHTLATPSLRLDSLEKLLSRAYSEDWAHSGWMASLFALFELPVNQPLPIAPLTRLGDANDSGNHIWLRADPVHLQAYRDQVLLFDTRSGFTLTLAEAQTLINEINPLYEEMGLQFSAPTPTRWYVALPQFPKLTTCPLPEVIGKNIQPYLPSGQDKTDWWKILNEIQMSLHQSPVNIEREARGELSINSVWFWGLGQLPNAPLPVRWSHVWTDEPLTRGLARLAQVPHSAVPANGKKWLAHLIPGEHLLTLFSPQDKIAQWATWLTELETEWFAPLFEAIKRRQFDAIILYPGQDQAFILTPAHARHYWWRRQRHWQSFISN
ncbi:signal peptide protein [Thioploca ingrica]|uniref:Signal peptide protein n=1 Tax=Thioploca ingrica TaxID=40754 RepID=A0A090AHZ0_9GAMM|nr:signal peptide protein [Thioploca ingrica]